MFYQDQSQKCHGFRLQPSIVNSSLVTSKVVPSRLTDARVPNNDQEQLDGLSSWSIGYKFTSFVCQSRSFPIKHMLPYSKPSMFSSSRARLLILISHFLLPTTTASPFCPSLPLSIDNHRIDNCSRSCYRYGCRSLF